MAFFLFLTIRLIYQALFIVPSDDAIKKEICFGETLIISCGHYEGDISSEESDSEWSCQDSTTRSEDSEEIKQDKLFEVKDNEEQPDIQEENKEEDDDFHFYFFPDCDKPLPPQHSKVSLLVIDGLPQVNPTAKNETLCTCTYNAKGRCDCFTKLPCYCGAKVAAECVCGELKEICICDETLPKPVCTCDKGAKVCVCFPTASPFPTCTCGQVEKPCICYEKSGKFPSPVCTCDHKPKFSEKLNLWSQSTHETSLSGEYEQSEAGTELEGIDENFRNYPCICQKAVKHHCLCLIGKPCICEAQSCVCGVQKTCVCEPTNKTQAQYICKEDSQDSRLVCECKKEPLQCTCEETGSECKCFAKKDCTCGSPDNCKCFVPCDCKDICVCDNRPTQKPETTRLCTCLDKKKAGDSVCTCRSKYDKLRKLKKDRVGKEGFRWCHDVDPRHTYFDYGYDRRDKLKAQEVEEKIRILGLHDDMKVEEECPLHGVKAPPPFKKKVRKPSIDCCSSVGGECFIA